MLKNSFIIVVLSLSLFGAEYDFNIEDIEPKPYEYGGYLRVDDRIQKLDKGDKEYQNYLRAEALLNYSRYYDIYRFKTSLIATGDYIKDKLSTNNFTANELYLEAKLNTNHSFLAGKESLGWGKGYFSNPVAFFDRAKDPTEPTQVREGFIIAKYGYNKSFDGSLKNINFDIVYLKADGSINKDYYNLVTNQKESNNFAMRLYLLLYDSDIDIIYNYSDVAKDKIGVDFSKNIETNFEIHAEYAKVIDESYSYLLGIRYLTDFELTIISEYLYQSNGLKDQEIKLSNSNLPFIAKDYAITLFTQKEPFSILYSSIYYKNMTNLQDYSQQNKIGATYGFKNNIDIDFSYNINSGDNFSEFGKKLASSFVWLRATWNY